MNSNLNYVQASPTSVSEMCSLNEKSSNSSSNVTSKSVVKNLSQEFSSEAAKGSDIEIWSEKLQLEKTILTDSGLFDSSGKLNRRFNSEGLKKKEFTTKFKDLFKQSPLSESIAKDYPKEMISTMYENLSGTELLKTENLKQVDYKITHSSNRQSVR